MAKIALSALQQRERLSGTGRYIAELFPQLPVAGPAHDFLLYIKKDQFHVFGEGKRRGRLSILDRCPSRPEMRVLWEWLSFTGQLKKDRVDLYHGPANFLPPRKVCPYVLTLHDMVYFTNPKRTSWFRAAYWQRSLRASVALADVIVTVSEFSKQEILRYLDLPESRIRVVLNGVSDSFFRIYTEEQRRDVCLRYGIEKPFICFLGRLDPDKNPAGLIEAYHSLWEAGTKDVDLVLTGGQDYRSEELKSRVETLGLASRVKFLGFVPDADMIPLLQSASVFCYPSFNEGFGLPVLEAMASGVPVVTSNCSSLPEVIGDAGIQVNPRSASDIAQGITDALDPSRAKEMSEAGVLRAKTMTWEKAARDVLSIYEEVLAKNK